MTRAWTDLQRVIREKDLLLYRWKNEGNESVNIGVLGQLPEDSLLIKLKDWPPVTMVLGVTGCGKSKGLIGILQQFILLRLPFTLIDPTGSILRELVGFLSELLHFAEVGYHQAQNDIERELYLDWMEYINDLIILDFSGEFGEVEYCFNPLYCHPSRPREGPEYVVSCLMRSCARLFKNFDVMKRLLNVVGAAATIAAEEGNNLFRILALIGMNGNEFQAVENALHQKATKAGRRKPHSAYAIKVMRELVIPTSGKERRDLIQSTRNALNVYLSKEKVRNFVSCSGSEPWALDFDEILNGNGRGSQGKTMLVHLPNDDLEFVKVTGNLLTTRVEQQARLRTPEQRKNPYFLIVDEMALTVDQGTAEAASIIRQLGLRMIIAGQSSMQPPFGTSDEGKAIFNTLLSQSWMKIFFRLDVEDAYRFAPYIHLSLGEMDKKKYLESTSSFASSEGQSVITKEGSSVGIGTESSKGMQVSKARTLGVSSSKGERNEDRHGEDVSFARSFEEHESYTEGNEQRETTGRDISERRSIGSTVSRESGQAQTTIDSSTHGDSRVRRELTDTKGGSSQAVQTTENKKNRTVNVVQSSAFKQSQTETQERGITQRSGFELATSHSHSKGHKRGTETREGEQHQKAFTIVSDKSMKRERTKGQTKTRSVTEKQSYSLTQGTDVARSNQDTTGVQVREVGGFHTLEQEKEIIATRLYTQPDRQAFVVQKPTYAFEEGLLAEGSLPVVQLQTHTIGDSVLGQVFHKNLLQSFLEFVSPHNSSPLVSTKEKREDKPASSKPDKNQKEVDKQSSALPEGLDL